MTSSYDLFAQFKLDSPNNNIEELIANTQFDPETKVRLMAASLTDKSLKEKAREAYRALVHMKGAITNAYVQNSLGPKLLLLRQMGLEAPDVEELVLGLPDGSFALQFRFKLAKPFISRDDSPFYIIENPIRKDKVFKLPCISAASWKGNLRWTAMYTRLALCSGDTSFPDANFAEERLNQTLLFGTEEGMHDEASRGWAKYIDDLRPDAVWIYQKLLKEHSGCSMKDLLPHQAGRLRFFPTFFDRIDLDVINPHDRKTGTGIQPIYFETAPAGSTGVFSLLYTPLDQLHLTIGDGECHDNESEDALLDILHAVIRETFLKYGFSAKKSSGYGVAERALDYGALAWAGDPEIKNFNSFDEL